MIFNKFVKFILIILVLLGIWYWAVTVLQVSVYVFPGPQQVFKALLVNRQIIFKNALITTTEAFLGFLIANFASVLIAIFISFHRRLENFVMPMSIWLKTMPVIALTPLLMIWFGPGMPSKVVMAMLVCFFPALVNVLEGIKVLDIKLVWLFKVYAANQRQLIQKLIFPSILPYLFAALKTSSSLAVVGAPVGEFIGSNRGLGFLIISNYYNMNTPLVFAAISVSSVIGISFYYFLDYFENKMIYNYSEVKLKEGRNQKVLSAPKHLKKKKGGG